MNPKEIELAKVPELAGSLAAIHRAAKRAAELAARTHTELIVVRDGKCVRVNPCEEQRSK